MPLRPALIALALAATPALAQSDLGIAEVGQHFCAAIVADDAAHLAPLLTPDLAALTAGRSIVWHSRNTAPTACMPVGASGSVEHPESVLFLTFPDGTTGSDKLVLSFIGENIRIDDIAFADGTTLRQNIATR